MLQAWLHGCRLSLMSQVPTTPSAQPAPVMTKTQGNPRTPQRVLVPSLRPSRGHVFDFMGTIETSWFHETSMKKSNVKNTPAEKVHRLQRACFLTRGRRICRSSWFRRCGRPVGLCAWQALAVRGAGSVLGRLASGFHAQRSHLPVPPGASARHGICSSLLPKRGQVLKRGFPNAVCVGAAAPLRTPCSFQRTRAAPGARVCRVQV